MSKDSTAGAASGSRGDLLTEESTSRENALFQCRVAENAERYDDMVRFVGKVVEGVTTPLEANERNYLSVAYKNAVGSRRAALRCLGAMKQKYESKGPVAKKNLEHVNNYYNEILTELQNICKEILSLIDNEIMSPKVLENLQKSRASTEFTVFFLKMKGDYFRYLAEFAEGDIKKDAVEKARLSYVKATEAAADGPEDVVLPPTHPIRLGLSLNYSVFLYEIQEQPELAKQHAKQAFELALDKLETVGHGSPHEAEYKDATIILQLLRDNSSLWAAQDGETTAGANNGAAASPPATGGDQPPPSTQKPGDANETDKAKESAPAEAPAGADTIVKASGEDDATK